MIPEGAAVQGGAVPAPGAYYYGIFKNPHGKFHGLWHSEAGYWSHGRMCTP